MIDPTTKIGELPIALEQWLVGIGEELVKIDKKIDPVIREQERLYPEDGLYRANLELKQTYIDEGKMAAFIEGFVAIQQLSAALLEQSVKLAESDAEEQAAAAYRVKEK